LDKGILALGIVLIIIAIILGAVRLSDAYDFGMRRLYLYGIAGIIGLIGIILGAWSYLRKKKP
jgi:hypothetical protein